MEAITSTVEDYLGLIYIMQREGKDVIGARLAERLGVSRPTVTVTLKRMLRDGLIKISEHKEISLTPRGLEVAQDLLRRHMLAEWLLCEVLGLPWHQVHEEADRLEHHFSEAAIDRLELLFEQPEVCPHGNPMPGMSPPPAVALSELAEGDEAVIVRIVEEAEDQRELMAFFEENELVPGVTIRAEECQPFNETVKVGVSDRSVVLGLAVAKFIHVQPKETGMEA
jgi:DtxR family Mn-dependent transcriptional regulator